jgi:hypothetical protein
LRERGFAPYSNSKWGSRGAHIFEAVFPRVAIKRLDQQLSV